MLALEFWGVFIITGGF